VFGKAKVIRFVTMASPPDPPRNQISYADKTADEEPQAMRPDHYDHDTAFARSKYAVLQPKKQEQVKLPKWTALFLFLMLIMIVLLFAKSVFKQVAP
jgi:hypothetical protein